MAISLENAIELWKMRLSCIMSIVLALTSSNKVFSCHETWVRGEYEVAGPPCAAEREFIRHERSLSERRMR